MAWYVANAKNEPHPVGLKAPNNWGLYDMHGNVSELCRDYLVHSLGTSPVTDPLTRRNGGTGLGYVTRGGSFSSSQPVAECRAAARAWRAPDNTGTLRSRDGIRVFLTLE